MKSSISNAAKSLNYKTYNNLSDTFLPRLPLLYKIGIAQNKGCRFFYETLRSKTVCLNKTRTKNEEKWHGNLGMIFSINYWDKIYKNRQKFLVPNKLIWTQIQINKYLLPTNHTVSHYNQNVSPQCSFGCTHPEKLHFLLWGCEVVQNFWNIIKNTIFNFYPRFVFGAKEAIFGSSELCGGSAINTLLILARYFIYQQKFTSKELDEVKFINYAKEQFTLIVNARKFKNKNKMEETEFTQDWIIFLDHYQVQTF